MMAGLLLRPPAWPRTALLVGLGAGSLAKFIYRYLPDCRITVVEINPQVEFVARQFFKLPDDAQRLDVLIGCGADYMLSGGKTFDCILVDGFDPEARTGPLDTLPFYQACRARLSDKGCSASTCLAATRPFRPASSACARPSTSGWPSFRHATAATPSPLRPAAKRSMCRWRRCANGPPCSRRPPVSTCCQRSRACNSQIPCQTGVYGFDLLFFLILQIPGLQRR
jgi:spermidine synthase